MDKGQMILKWPSRRVDRLAARAEHGRPIDGGRALRCNSLRRVRLGRSQAAHLRPFARRGRRRGRNARGAFQCWKVIKERAAVLGEWQARQRVDRLVHGSHSMRAIGPFPFSFRLDYRQYLPLRSSPFPSSSPSPPMGRSHVTLFSLAQCLALLHGNNVAATPLISANGAPQGGGGAAATQNDPSLIDVTSSSFGGSRNSQGVGGGLAGSVEICVAGDVVCLGDAGAVAAGVLGNEAVGEGKATGAKGTQGSVAQAEVHGNGIAAADAANLCLIGNCFGGGGALGLGDAEAGAVGGALHPSSASKVAAAASTAASSSSSTSSVVKAGSTASSSKAAVPTSTSGAAGAVGSAASNAKGSANNSAQDAAHGAHGAAQGASQAQGGGDGTGKARRCRRRLDSGTDKSI
ncbi:hypothetical protein BDZ90DRAFT_31994 [Jaminaea rosea]|uniref:Uncharacterized protein n=1 Tax=Jaminaea rosea TaxID=1569628 RepID=A0A316V0G5_9BASI|nr:hypothetical protein BDZ90DRAFT_31994 [Jaminaea rosea]PWN31040.1 hypothetical protein BDZ90DRAFT_31994 [Jaminaea rosea]